MTTLSAIMFYVDLKTQKEELKRNYEGRNHKKEFNN